MNAKVTVGVIALLIAVASFLYYWSDWENKPLQHSIVEAPPSISYLDILNNPEFKTEFVRAILANDHAAMVNLQDKAIEIGIAANLGPDEMSLLQGEEGMRFIQFRAKRELFMQEFTHHYNQLLPVENLKRQYPEATDLFEKADRLITQRDRKIEDIARQMAGTDNFQPYLDLARQQWKDRANTKSGASPNPSLR